MVYTGRIFEIVHVNDKVSQIILKKKDKDKIARSREGDGVLERQSLQ